MSEKEKNEELTEEQAERLESLHNIFSELEAFGEPWLLDILREAVKKKA